MAENEVSRLLVTTSSCFQVVAGKERISRERLTR
nr:MAG TPA: hypothetical protein [Caudoviricetes sp.]